MEALTSAQKAAIIISSIGTENASEVFKHFSDEEVEQITLEIARMNYYPMEVVDSVLNEFYELCLTQKVISEGGVEYARDILEKAFGPQTAQALFEKITKQFQTKAFAFVRKADYKKPACNGTKRASADNSTDTFLRKERSGIGDFKRTAQENKDRCSRAYG